MNKYLLLALVFGTFFSCAKSDHEHDDDDDDEIEMEVDTMIEAPLFKTVSVNIFTSHPTIRIQEAVFETYTEQVLTQEAHNLGATFEIVSEQVLLKEGATSYQVSTSEFIQLVTNAETFKIAAVPCVTFFEEADVVKTILPAVYESRSIIRVMTNGTGAIVPAKYSTRTFQRNIADATMTIDSTQPRTYEHIHFKIPQDMEFDNFLAQQLQNQAIEYCLQPGSYEIEE